MTYFLWDKFDLPVFRGVALKPGYSDGNHFQTLLDSRFAWCPKTYCFFGGRAGQQEEKADSRAYFMYLLLYVFMMVTMFVCCGASV